MKKIIPFLLIVLLIISYAKDNKIYQNLSINQTENQMVNQNYTSTIVVKKNAQTAFNAIKNFRAWWSEEILGETGTLGETFFYHYKDVHLCKIRLNEEINYKKLVYVVTENEFNFVEDKTEWVNTKLIFEIVEENNQTKVVFTHEGLTPEYECYEVCNDAWTSYIQGSLKDLIESGTGKPNAKEGGLNDMLIKKWGLPDK
jgi:hypothetical protein